MTRHCAFPPTTALGQVDDVQELLPGVSLLMRDLRRLVALVAPHDAPVMVCGPSGSGKEFVARAVHRLSGRRGAFVAVNCAAIPSDLLEGELFGHERGAFTGADRARRGLIEAAAGGTLFLDEIGEMPAALQAKVLRIIETREVRRLGGLVEVPVDFRLVSATHRNLQERVAQGTFREDLYFRLAVLPLDVPPLIARIEDLPVLLDAMLRIAAGCAADPPSFAPDAVERLAAHSWPGNLRELKTVVQRACVLFPGSSIGGTEVEDNLLTFSAPGAIRRDRISPDISSPADGSELSIGLPIDLRNAVRRFEMRLIDTAMAANGNCVSKSAVALRMSRTTLLDRLRRQGRLD